MKQFMEEAIATLRASLNSPDPDLVGVSILLGCIEQLLVRKGPALFTDLQVPTNPPNPALASYNGK